MRRTWPATFVLVALVLVLVALSVPSGILARKPVDPLALLGVLVAALGLLITRRQPGNLHRSQGVNGRHRDHRGAAHQ